MQNYAISREKVRELSNNNIISHYSEERGGGCPVARGAFTRTVPKLTICCGIDIYIQDILANYGDFWNNKNFLYLEYNGCL